MQPAARIAAIADRFRSARFPDNVVAAIQDYLSGQGTLAWWLTGMRVTNDRYHLRFDSLVGLVSPNSTSLDEIDRRLLDVCYATKNELAFITSIAADGPAEQVRDYLMEQGVAEHLVLSWFLNIRRTVADNGRHPAALERVLLADIPGRFGELAPLWQSNSTNALPLLKLLLASRPPYPELAWRVAEDMLDSEWGTRLLTPTLLAADRAFFFERVRPALQRHVADADFDWQAMLNLLLAEPWDGRGSYAASLLTHRYSQIRTAIVDWLAEQSEAVIDHVAPYLEHADAETRQAAARVLGRIGGERARALLVARRAVEPTAKVRQALYEAIGFPWATGDDQTEPQPFIAALTAEAEQQVGTSFRPVLAWATPGVMPALQWTTGEPVPPAVVEYLLTLQSQTPEAGAGAHLRQFAAVLDRRGAAEWAAALLAGWLGQGAPAKEAWLLPLVGLLGDDRLVLSLRERIEEWSKGPRGAVAARAVHALALIGSEAALATVEELGERIKHKQVQDAARSALLAAAQRRGLTIDDLADQTVPHLGFDERGERVFDYGPRRFTVRLGHDLTVRVSDQTGKKLTGLPRPLMGDDSDRAAAAQAEWQRLKAQVKQAAKQQAARLERALVSQRVWSVARWQALFLHHPLLRPFAITLVWGLLDEAGTGYTLLFRPLADGTLTDPDDEPVDLPAEGGIRLVHPVELDEATHAAWLAHLNDYEVSPPFPQLSRPVVRVQPEARHQQWWEHYCGYLLNGGALKGRYQKAGWQRGSVLDGGVYDTLWKSFPAAGIEAVLETAGLAVGSEQAFTTAIKRLAFARAGTLRRGSYVYDDLTDDDERALTLGEVPPVVFSEAAGDVATFAAAGQYDPDWERKV